MSKASVAQEPSMDEILASIRRIIETGEDRAGATARPVSSGPRPGSGDGEGGSQLPRLSERFEARDFPAYSRSPNPILAAAAAIPATETTTALEMEDDRLTADLEEELAASWDHPDPGALAPFAAAAEPVAAEPAPVEPPAPSAPTEKMPAMSDLPSFDRRPEFEPRAEPSAETLSADRTGFQPANSDRPAPGGEDRYEAVTLPLTSEATGSLVAASFNDLAQAIRSGELRSIEAMAQEMLRPMLQEWLDDNLPRMVERLVRDEIERMSRGGRR